MTLSTTTSDLRVADLMTIDPVVVAVDATIEEAEELLRRNRITGLPVVNADGRLVGVISQTDLLYLAVPAVQALVRHHERGVRVGEVMSTPPVTIDGSESLLEAARTMNDAHVHRLVAVDAVGQPIGVISAMDFVGLYADLNVQHPHERSGAIGGPEGPRPCDHRPRASRGDGILTADVSIQVAEWPIAPARNT